MFKLRQPRREHRRQDVALSPRRPRLLTENFYIAQVTMPLVRIEVCDFKSYR